MKFLIIVLCLAAGSLAEDEVNLRHTLIGSIPSDKILNKQGRPVDPSDACLYCFEVALDASKDAGGQKISAAPPTTKGKFAFMGLHNCAVDKAVIYQPLTAISTKELSISGLTKIEMILGKINAEKYLSNKIYDPKKKEQVDPVTIVKSILSYIKDIKDNKNTKTDAELMDFIKDTIEICFKYANFALDNGNNGNGWIDFPFKFVSPSFKKKDDSDFKVLLNIQNSEMKDGVRPIEIGSISRGEAKSTALLYLGKRNGLFNTEDIKGALKGIGCEGVGVVHDDIKNYIYLEPKSTVNRREL